MKSRSLGIASLALLTSFGAQAVSVEFDFNVLSSGSNIYVCNVGLKHAPHQSAPIGKGSDICTEDGDARYCTGNWKGNSKDGEYLYDSFRATYSDWSEWDDYGSNGNKSTSVKAGKNSYSSLFENDKAAFGKMVKSLNIFLTSERYGAEWYVDVCYRGPQVFDATALNDPNYTVRSEVTVNDFHGTSVSYASSSKLYVTADVVCDMHEKNDVINFDGRLFSGSSVPAEYSSDLGEGLVTELGNVFTPQSKTIKANGSKSPKFCKVRYTFSESKRNDPVNESHIRKWKVEGANISTYTAIDEPDVEI